MLGKPPLLRLGTLVMLAAVPLALGHRAAAQGLTEKDVTREFGYIALKDGTKLSYVTYRPLKEGKYPVLLEFSPYGVDGTAFTATVKQYLDRGYAYAGVDIRGTSCSGGTLSMFDPIIATDGVQVVEWVGSRAWANGVGMIGASYPGHTQIFTASARPKYLKAIAAGALTASSYREAWRPAGMFNQSFIGGWAFSERFDAAKLRVEWGDKECDLEKARTYTRKTYYEVLEHPLLDDWWKARDLETYVEKIEVPTLIVQGWQDHQTQVSGAIHLFKLLKPTSKKMLLQPGGHGVYRRAVSRDEWLRFFDHHLKGENNGVEKEPQVKVWWEVRDVNGEPTPNWTTTYASWPPPTAKPMTFYLTADGKLARMKQAASRENGARGYTYPLGTELIADNDQFAVRTPESGMLTYRSTAMTEDMTLLGFSQLTFYMSSEQKDTDVMVVLHDIDENGDTMYLTRDFLRASLRAIDPAKSSAEEQVRSFAKSEPLTPGQIYEMKLSIPPIGQVIRKGHSLELAIMSPSHIGQPNWGFSILDLPGRNTVYHSEQYPSSLTVSVLPGVIAQAPAPPCGVMERQPCRKALRRPAQTAPR